MKTTTAYAVFFCLMATVLYADAPRGDSIEVSRVVKVANPDKLTGWILLAYVTGPQLPGIKSYHIVPVAADEPIDKFFDNNAVSLIVVPRSLVYIPGLDAVDFPSLVEQKRLVPAAVAAPFVSHRWAETPGQLYHEEIVYAATGVCDGSVSLQPAGKILKYTDGRETAKDYFAPPAVVREYKRKAVAADVWSSSQLKDDTFPDRYHPVRVFDGLPETGWSEQLPGPGLGANVSIVFEQPITIDNIAVLPGWFQAAYFKKNNRIKTMDIVLDHIKTTARFTDAMTAQNVALPSRPGGKITFRKAEFTIREVYPGSDWDDTPLAEIMFFIDGEPIFIDCGRVKTEVSILGDS